MYRPDRESWGPALILGALVTACILGAMALGVKRDALLSEAKERAQRVPPGTIVHRLPPTDQVLYEVTLSDGSRCVTSSAGGVACMWADPDLDF